MMRVNLNHLTLVMWMRTGISHELAAYASTKLININALYTAAQAVDCGGLADDEMFTVTGGKMGNKLRARIDGSFQQY